MSPFVHWMRRWHAQMLALVRDHAREKLLILVTHDPEDAQGMQRIDLKTV